jgi:hypothetical protein
MANTKISALTAATTPLAGTEVLPIVQSGATVKASISNVQTSTYSGGTANGVAYLNGSKVLTTGTALTFDGTNLGVGTTSPAVPLDVVANSSALNLKLRGRSADSIGQMEFWNNANTTRYGYLSSESTAITLATVGALPLKFVSNGSERGSFDSSGNFLTGTTSNGGLSNTVIMAQVYNTTTASAANVHVDNSPAGLMRRSTSALKYKQDIRDLESIDIFKFRPVRYKSKCKGDDQTKDHLGLISDEVAEAGIEELVTRGSDGSIEGFQYERLTVVLLKTIQDLKTEFNAYKASHP